MPSNSRRRVASCALAALAALAACACPAAAQLAPPAPVEETTLSKDAFSTGVLNKAEGALPADLWRDANPKRLRYLLSALPAKPAGPALGEAMRRILLSPGTAPEGATPALGGGKLLALARAGFIDETRTVASLSDAPRNDPYVAEALATADLLSGATDAACRRNANLSSGRDELFWVKLRVLCYAAAGERDAADLTLTLLREQGALGDVDDALLTALATGVAPKTPPAPETALHLAAIRQMELPLAAGLLYDAEAGVLKAAAMDSAIDGGTRIAAANRAAAMGVMSISALKRLYADIPADVGDIARASELVRTRAGDPMTDVVLFKAISQMSAPEFLRDKAARIGDALAIAGTFSRAYAASLLYADDIKALEGALVQPHEAGLFAQARMAAGDGDGAARWLFTMLGSGGFSSLAEEDSMEMIELTNLLAVLDPISAAGVAEAAGVSLESPSAHAGASAADVDEQKLARILEAAFDAAMEEIPGQAGLAALAASNAAPPTDPIAQVVINQSLRAAGLNGLRRRMDFEAAWRAKFAAKETGLPEPMSGGGGEEEEMVPTSADGPTPRLKPSPSGE